jgi:hypothetical protein
MIDAHFASNRGIYLSEQSARYLDQRYASQIDGGGKSCQVSDDSPAEGYEGFTSLGAAFGKPVYQLCQLHERLGWLAGRHLVQ